MTALVVCVGNPLRGDDAVAWHVADHLSAVPARVITCHQLTPELAEDAAAASHVVIVDACDDGSPPGEVQVSTPANPRGATPAVSHAFGPADLLALAADLYGAQPEATLVTVSAATTDVAVGLSPEVAAAVPVAAEAVRRALTSSAQPTDVR